MESWFSETFSCTEPDASDLGRQQTNLLGQFNAWLQENGASHHVLGVSTTRDGYGRLCLTVKLRKKHDA